MHVGTIRGRRPHDRLSAAGTSVAGDIRSTTARAAASARRDARSGCR